MRSVERCESVCDESNYMDGSRRRTVAMHSGDVSDGTVSSYLGPGEVTDVVIETGYATGS